MAKSIKSTNLLPEFLRTDKNQKFLSSTFDQLIQPPQLERIDGFIGSKLTPTYISTSDVYISESLISRRDYNLEPALVIYNTGTIVDKVVSFDDLTNELATNGGIVDNLNRIYKTDYYSFDPNIDFDKLVNYQEYYWLPNGPDAISIEGNPIGSTSTLTISDSADGKSFIINSDNSKGDPYIILYRGNTYYFEINSQHKFYIKTEPTSGDSDLYQLGIENNGASSGVIKFTVDNIVPRALYYASDDPNFYGDILILSRDEYTHLNVETEILNKKNYISGNGVQFSNGMKVKFVGSVEPASYLNKEFYVEGVGEGIRLINTSKLAALGKVGTSFTDVFDGTPFDNYPFDSEKNLPINPDYITINRASKDLNPWSRYNRWFHSDIIKQSAILNGSTPVYPIDQRAKRPIIEFKSDIQLYNYGTTAIDNVDVIDNDTKNVFLTVEGSDGYYVDGVLLQTGYRVIFNGDIHNNIRGNVYQVIFSSGKIHLELVDSPATNSSVGVELGTANGGKNYWFNGTNWVLAQSLTSLNQPPLFDVFDNTGISYSDKTQHLSSFEGTKVFGYDIGTGTADPVLGFPLRYKNSIGVGSYLFKNYFASDTFPLSNSNGIVFQDYPVRNTFLKKGNIFVNVWKSGESYEIPIIQFQTTTEDATSSIEINSINTVDSIELTVDAFINFKQVPKNQLSIVSNAGRLYVHFENSIKSGSNVLLKLYTPAPVNENGYYETPLGLTNNPLNGPITSLTLSDLSDHVRTMIGKNPVWTGVFPGSSNIRDISNISSYGTRLISNPNPLAFAQMFIGNEEHSLFNAISRAAVEYNEFKLNFINRANDYVDQINIVSVVDEIITGINTDKNILSPHYFSDMIGYGDDKIVRSWVVKSVRNKIFPITQDFDPNTMSLRSVYVYVNDVQQTLGKDYVFLEYDSSIEFLKPLSIGDVVIVNDYNSTEGCYIPSTPSKLGLYPKFQPRKFVDNTFLDGEKEVIQGHDGSITIAFGDYRDDLLLELELRIFNNIKTTYREELLNIHHVVPGAFRPTDYSIDEINQLLQSDFIKWVGLFGLDYQTNSTYDSGNGFTWNYVGEQDKLRITQTTGYWRGVYKYYFDTDLPHLTPWEMLGFSVEPDWWESEYGPAPYTSGNEVLWRDLEKGLVKQGARQGIHPEYARPGLTSIVPVDESGNLLDPSVNLLSYSSDSTKRQGWSFGDQGPVETAWRRSSSYPFAVQRLLALTKPVDYASLMFDTSRITKNIAGQWTYGDAKTFLRLNDLLIHGNGTTIGSGYGVYVVEYGKQQNVNYIQKLSNDLSYANFNLFHKVGGFVSKNKIKIIVDAIAPLSTDPGSLLPQENYSLILNTSNPIKSIGLSGIVIQKLDTGFLIKGYDRSNPYFNIFESVRNNTTPGITIGGVSEPYVNWTYQADTGNTNGLSAYDTASATAPTVGQFYQEGQIVKYNGKFYRVKTSHRSEATFNSALYASIPSLPVVGGITVQLAASFNSSVKRIPYGTTFSTIQEVYDVIIGYGKYLESLGFVFDNFNAELNSNLDWNFTAKEFLYWTTQNWAINSIITLSPFADKVTYKSNNSVVGNIFNPLYEYAVLKADGSPLQKEYVTVNRQDGICTIQTVTTNDGIYFINLKPVQKEHGMVFDNTTIFNDTIFDPETGYRQLRMQLIGFRTSGWNGDYFSPGFIFDTAEIYDWTKYYDYQYGAVVKFNGSYYSAKTKISGTAKFSVSDGWILLDKKPVPELIPNFDYKINQFEDFYSLDVDNFDAGQQKMAQHLIGYTPRVYMDNIFSDPISQYKFYQGFIKEKGTKNAVDKIVKAAIHNQKGRIDFKEEWALRTGYFGGFQTFNELEATLSEGTFIENPQAVEFVTDIPSKLPNDLVSYVDLSKLTRKPDDYVPENSFVVDSETFIENKFVLSTAGYVNFDDITYTIYNELSLYDLANPAVLNVGDAFWLGFKLNGDWDVFTYEKVISRITDVFVSTPGSEITFVTEYAHNLSVGDIISTVAFNIATDGIYSITRIDQENQFSVASDLTAITDQNLTTASPLFKFTSRRYDSFDVIPSDYSLLKLPYGSKVWVDDKGDQKWAVYEKNNNWSGQEVASVSTPIGQKFGWTVAKRNNSDMILVGAPSYKTSQLSRTDYGRVFLYSNSERFTKIELILSYILNSYAQVYVPDASTSEFGYSLVYSATEFNKTGYGLMYAGAPAASHVYSTMAPNGTVRYSTGTGSSSSFTQEGIVKISSVNQYYSQEITEYALLSPAPANYQRFGASLFLEESTTTQLLLVGAPGTASTGTGHVYAYTIDATGSKVLVTPGPGNSVTVTKATSQTGDRFGHAISGNLDSSVIAISAPSAITSTVYVYSDKNFATSIALTYPFGANSEFGHSIKVSATGNYIIVSAPNVYNSSNNSYGSVVVYSLVLGSWVVHQVITNPIPHTTMRFGHRVDLNEAEDELVISAIGLNNTIVNIFDHTQTNFDSGVTTFFNDLDKSGAVYIYTRKTERFVLADQIEPPEFITGTDFGYSLLVDDNNIFIGAPAYDTTATSTVSSFYQYSKIDKTASSWKLLRYQEDTVSVDQFKSVCLIDTFNDKILSYLDVIDPLKGKIAGIADQEIKYKSSFDPAVYSIGTSGVNVDTDSNWLDEHVGELWWDLSSVKYVWYEQSNLLYRKNNWNKIFPGSSIDVYEWVGTPYLPTEWSAVADTPAGLTADISGQPKFSDNSIISVKQVYDNTSQTFVNHYYYWVKNKIIVPNVQNRRISSYQVASLIADPTSYGYEYAAFIDKNAVALANINSKLVGDRITLNVTYDYINNSVPRHTEWKLLQEGDPTSMPGSMYEKKLYDSLLGHDTLGNLVPDPTLNNRSKYGISIRPQQTLFKDKREALRNLIEFSNSVLIKNQITGNYNFANLNAQELPPQEVTHEWDEQVEDNQGLLLVNTNQLETAELICTVFDGKIRGVQIIKPGKGYKLSPTVTIENNKNGAVISTEINASGAVVNAYIVNAGAEFKDNTPPKLTVRPYTVIVLADNLYNGKWTKFVWNVDTLAWDRARTQKYNTPLYWNYVDWSSSDYNKFKDYKFTFDGLYQLNELIELSVPGLTAANPDVIPLNNASISINNGDYVKIKNPGDGLSIILEKIPSSVVGTFSKDFNIVYKQQGTVQISDNIWKINNNLGYDLNNSFDQTLYDQTLDLELTYILNALRDDIFINELKVNWNLFFFKAIRYALGEQKLLDWAFKTSFINVTNYSGSLDQPPVYKLQNAQYYEDFLNEVKPYHTQIRSFTNNYQTVEPTKTFTTDFDLPAVYDQSTKQFSSIGTGSGYLDYYPWKAWADNHSFEIDSIVVAHAGEGYITPPLITITAAEGDTGSGATARAYIASGKISQIVLTNPGQGYTKVPQVIITDREPVVTTAVATARLTNNKVRVNKIGMKFDRISYTGSVEDLTVTDRFYTDGIEKEFVLNWLPAPDKVNMNVTLNGKYILKSDFNLKYYTEAYNGYAKRFAKLQFLNYVPDSEQILEVTYKKNIEILNAASRVLTYYTATSGMAGVDLPQLMTGIEYPKTQLQSLKFDYSTTWDSDANPFGYGAYAEDIEDYSVVKTFFEGTVGSYVVEMESTATISVGQNVNVISTLTQVFDTSTVKVVSIDYSAVTFSSSLTSIIAEGTSIEFWTSSKISSSLDTVIDGGTWSTSTNTNNVLIGGLGINPEDITIDGDGFYTPNTSYAPEEVVPGESADSIGINVYTKPSKQRPVVFSGYARVDNTATRTTLHLGITPPNVSSIVVTYNDEILEYTGDEFYSSYLDVPLYFLDWTNNTISIGPKSTNGIFAYTVVTIGGEGVVDHSYVTADIGTTSTFVQSLSYYQDINAAYVSVNGEPIGTDSRASLYYELSYVGTEVKRAAVIVYGLYQGRTNTIQAWFFRSATPNYNHIKEQQLFINEGDNIYDISLNQPPGTIGPEAPQAIVQYEEGGLGRNYRRLLPPLTNYYDVRNPRNNVFGVSTRYSHDPAYFTTPNVRVYINGIQLNPGFDYSVSYTVNGLTGKVDSNQSRVTVSRSLLETGDVVAVLSRLPGEYDYDILNGTLEFAQDAASIDTPINVTSSVKIVTYTDHDSMLMRTERFEGNTYRRFAISRPILDNNYVWVQLNYTPLANRADYTVLDDGITIQIADHVPVNPTKIITTITNTGNVIWVDTPEDGFTLYDNQKIRITNVQGATELNGNTYRVKVLTPTRYELYYPESPINTSTAVLLDPNSVGEYIGGGNVMRVDEVEITSLSNQDNLGQILGYRIFNDIFDRTSFKRFSVKNTTQLARPLSYLDTEIYVVNANVLTPPSKPRKAPGVVLIDGERIEFYHINNNVLSQLRRGTLGTGSKYYYDIGSKVIDQGSLQTIPFSETIRKQVLYTSENQKSYKIHTTAYTTQTTNFANTVTSDGITLAQIPGVKSVDQVTVYYGSRQLNKVPTLYHDVTVAYDSQPYTLVGSLSSELNLPLTSSIGDAYRITSNNKVWVQSGSTEVDAIHGFVYRGLHYIESEFTINTSTQVISLNIAEPIIDNVKLTIVKKDFARNTVWNDEITSVQTASLLDSTTKQAKFLKEKPAELPNIYYYGGQPVLQADGGDLLTDDDRNPLEGI